MSEPAPGAVAKLTPLDLAGPAGRLEALLQEREGESPARVALVCHPHPLYGGTLHNKVVHRAASTLFGMGLHVLRFNFRGVGRSEGAWDRGRGELDDARAAFEWLRDRHPSARRWVLGFSFGSYVAARLAAERPDVERLVLIAPPVHTQDFGFLKSCTTPKLVVQGTADDVCRPENLAAQYPSWSEPRRLIEVPDASHFFDRKLHELGDALLAGLADA